MISFGASGSGSRTVNVTSARGAGVAVGPVGLLGFGGPAVGNDGHSSREMAQAWLVNARIMIKDSIRREKTKCDFMLSPQHFTLRL